MKLPWRQLSAFALLIFASGFAAHATADDWPQWRGPHRDGVWREDDIVREFDGKRLDPEWKVEIGAGYSGPTVADDRVFITDRMVEPEQIERVLCFDAKTGQQLWKFQYPCKYTISYTAGPRASVTIDDDEAYALGAMGHLHVLDVGTGDVLWKKDLAAEFKIRMPIWGIASAPLIYDDLLILLIGGGDGACVIALDKDNGDLQWKALRDRAQYSAPIIIQQAGRDVLVCWTGDSVAGLDPESGRVYWRHPFAPSRMPIGIATPVVDEKGRLFVTSFYDGSLMLRLKNDTMGIEKLWHKVGPSERDTEALQSIIATPILADDHIYGVDSYGELRCLDAETGKRIWEDQTATPRARWSNIHMVRHGNKVWMFNERGELLIARLSPDGFEELDRTKIIDPTPEQLRRRDGVTWSHPAFADRHLFIRNDEELVCVSLED